MKKYSENSLLSICKDRAVYGLDNIKIKCIISLGGRGDKKSKDMKTYNEIEIEKGRLWISLGYSLRNFSLGIYFSRNTMHLEVYPLHLMCSYYTKKQWVRRQERDRRLMEAIRRMEDNDEWTTYEWD